MGSTNSQPASYDSVYFAPLFDIEDRHFWFRARNQILATVLDQVTPTLPPHYRVLEIGCGTGNVLRILEERCPGQMVVGMDLFAEGLHYARRRVSCALVQGDIYAPPFEGKFDLVGVFDVLEHLPDDVRMLQALYQMLTPGGVLMLTVPAYQSLWSYFDEASHHCRRYEPAHLREKLIQVGFQIDYLTPYMTGIFPLVWLGRRLAAVMPRRNTTDAKDLAMNELRITPVVNDVLSWLLAGERSFIARRRRLPVGTSLLAVVRKSTS